MNHMNVLVMGLPGCGKSTLSQALVRYLINHKLTVEYFNADEVRRQANDFDFSLEGRMRQCLRMKNLCNTSKSVIRIADFVCPTNELREEFNADYVIWVNTKTETLYADTLSLFEPPLNVDIIVTTQDAITWASDIAVDIISKLEDIQYE